MFLYHLTGPTVELTVTEKSGNPLRLNGSISVQCKWSKEYFDKKIPNWKKTAITFWWKDVRKENFVQVCQVLHEPSEQVTTCSNIESYPEFDAGTKETGGIETIKVKDIWYKSAVKCSQDIYGDTPYPSAEIQFEVTGKCHNYLNFHLSIPNSILLKKNYTFATII